MEYLHEASILWYGATVGAARCVYCELRFGHFRAAQLVLRTICLATLRRHSAFRDTGIYDIHDII